MVKQTGGQIGPGGKPVERMRSGRAGLPQQRQHIHGGKGGVGGQTADKPASVGAAGVAGGAGRARGGRN